jgi:galactose-1-phosphate uridylyltransferase
MPSLIAYRKVSDALTTHTLRLPQPKKMGDATGQEIATLQDGRTIVVLPDGVMLPVDQPAAIKSTIEVLPAVLPDALKNEIREVSPHVRLINTRMQERIRSRYSAEDEMKFSRIGTGQALGMYKMTDAEKTAMFEFGTHLEACRQWAKGERAKLGV